MGAWSPSLDGDLDPMTGVEWVGLVCAWGTNGACVSRLKGPCLVLVIE